MTQELLEQIQTAPVKDSEPEDAAVVEQWDEREQQQALRRLAAAQARWQSDRL